MNNHDEKSRAQQDHVAHIACIMSSMKRIVVITVLVLPVFLGGCRQEKAAAPAARDRAAGSSRSPEPLRPATDSVDQLIETRVPRAIAGQPGWIYQQRVSADLDMDGTSENAVLISDVTLDTRGQPMWEHGHRWQVYVEEAGGARTYLYARFLPNGKLTAELTQPESTTAPTLTLIEQTPANIAVYEISYNGAGKAEIVTRFERRLRPGTFGGSPRP